MAARSLLREVDPICDVSCSEGGRACRDNRAYYFRIANRRIWPGPAHYYRVVAGGPCQCLFWFVGGPQQL